MNPIPRILPPALRDILVRSKELGFDMASDQLTGALLRTLAASRPGGSFLEIGTGTGLSTAWLLEGMDRESRLLSIDNDGNAQAVATGALGADRRVTFLCVDGDVFLEELQMDRRFDLIFADSWPGKYRLLEVALDHLSVGGFYVVDDMLPQANWPEGHALKAAAFRERLAERPDLVVSELDWSTGLILATKRRPPLVSQEHIR